MKVGAKKDMSIGNSLVGSKKSARSEYHFLKSAESDYHMVPTDYSSRDCMDKNEGSNEVIVEIEDNCTDTESEFNMSEGSSPKNNEEMGIRIDLDHTKSKVKSGNKNEKGSSKHLDVAEKGGQRGNKVVIKAKKELEKEKLEEEDEENNWYVLSLLNCTLHYCTISAILPAAYTFISQLINSKLSYEVRSNNLCRDALKNSGTYEHTYHFCRLHHRILMLFYLYT